MYRIGGAAELAELGIEEYFNDRCICLIEWAEVVSGILPGALLRRVVRARRRRESERTIRIEGPQEERAG